MERVTINLRDGDFGRLRDLFPDLGAGPAIRLIISNFVDRAEAAVRSGLPSVEVDL